MERVDSGSFQLPLYAGEVRRDLLLAMRDNIANNGVLSLERFADAKVNDKKDKSAPALPPLKRLEWASVFVRLVDEQRSQLIPDAMGVIGGGGDALSCLPLINTKYLPKARSDKYKYDPKEVNARGWLGLGAAPKQLKDWIPSGSTPDKFGAALLAKVAAAAGIEHYKT
jgi:hypothetical protein